MYSYVDCYAIDVKSDYEAEVFQKIKYFELEKGKAPYQIEFSF